MKKTVSSILVISTLTFGLLTNAKADQIFSSAGGDAQAHMNAVLNEEGFATVGSGAYSFSYGEGDLSGGSVWGYQEGYAESGSFGFVNEEATGVLTLDSNAWTNGWVDLSN